MWAEFSPPCSLKDRFLLPLCYRLEESSKFSASRDKGCFKSIGRKIAWQAEWWQISAPYSNLVFSGAWKSLKVAAFPHARHWVFFVFVSLFSNYMVAIVKEKYYLSLRTKAKQFLLPHLWDRMISLTKSLSQNYIIPQQYIISQQEFLILLQVRRCSGGAADISSSINPPSLWSSRGR